MQVVTRDKIGHVLSSAIEPVARVRAGETFIVETEDAWVSRYSKQEDMTPEKLRIRPRTNPVTGPIYIEDAEPGDMIAIHIEEIEPDTYGYTRFRTDGGTLPYWFAEPRGRITPIVDGKVQFNDDIKIPLQPMIGTIGTAHNVEELSSLVPGVHGGNMDCRDVGPGSILYLPVFTPGALLYVGDVHAVQGDGEVCGVAVETKARVRLTVHLHKGCPPEMSCPRVETEDYIITVASANPLEQAVRIALRDMVLWLAADYGFDPADAYMLITQIGDARICQMVNPVYTAAFQTPKKYLRPNG
ncbi:MAG: acetamidase/formamidase family protein [Limnochordia bacterium]|jgi:amidase